MAKQQKKKSSTAVAKRQTSAVEIPPAEGKPFFNPTYLQDPFASILTDYIRQYVGTYRDQPTADSGVVLNRDRVLSTQFYLDMAGYDLYDEIERDPHVSGIYQTIRTSVAALDWFIAPASESDADKKIAQEIERLLRDVDGFIQDVVELLDAVGKGFSVSEILKSVNREGFVTPVRLMHRPQRRMQFDPTGYALKVRKTNNPFYGDPAPDETFIVHRNSQKYENPFGDALDQRLYWMWLFKRNVIKIWMQFQENFSAPFPLGKYDPNATQEFKTALLDLLGSFRRSGYGIAPNTVQIDLMQSQGVSSVGDAYERFIRFANDEMTKCILGEVLTTEGSASGGAGAKAGASESRTISKARIQYYAKGLEDTLNSTLIRWMVKWNFADGTLCPKFRFDTSEPVDAKVMSEVIVNLKTAGYKVTDAYIEDTLGIPLEEVEPAPQVVPVQQKQNEPGLQIAASQFVELMKEALQVRRPEMSEFVPTVEGEREPQPISVTVNVPEREIRPEFNVNVPAPEVVVNNDVILPPSSGKKTALIKRGPDGKATVIEVEEG